MFIHDLPKLLRQMHRDPPPVGPLSFKQPLGNEEPTTAVGALGTIVHLTVFALDGANDHTALTVVAQIRLLELHRAGQVAIR